MKNRKLYWKICIILAVIITVLNLLAVKIPSFSQKYIETVYAFLSERYTLLTEQVPLPLGEIMMYIAAAALLAEVVLFILFILKFRKKDSFKRHFKNYSKTLLMTGVVVLLVYTVFWLVPFRYHVSQDTQKKYTLENLKNLQNHLVEELNQCAEEMPRDEDGYLVFEKNTEEKVRAAMKAQEKVFPFLKGHLPEAKPAICSSVLDWMNIGGYTYPYTMEVTLNKYISDLYYPSLYAHELSHHKGYYQEDDANFISEIVCINSGSPYLAYSGYLDAYGYVAQAYKTALFSSMDQEAAQAVWEERMKVSEQVQADLVKNREDYEASYNADSHPAQGFSDSAQKISEKGWDLQAEVLQEHIYSGVVRMLLDYYQEIIK